VRGVSLLKIGKRSREDDAPPASPQLMQQLAQVIQRFGGSAPTPNVQLTDEEQDFAAGSGSMDHCKFCGFEHGDEGCDAYATELDADGY
jgi:hypothetical protein